VFYVNRGPSPTTQVSGLIGDMPAGARNPDFRLPPGRQKSDGLRPPNPTSQVSGLMGEAETTQLVCDMRALRPGLRLMW
jgi:hypothetical protein